MAIVAVADNLDCTGLVVVDILLAARILVEELASQDSPAEEGIFVVGNLEGDIVQGAAVGILLLWCYWTINRLSRGRLTRWRSTVLRWIAALVRWIRHDGL